MGTPAETTDSVTQISTYEVRELLNRIEFDIWDEMDRIERKNPDYVRGDTRRCIFTPEYNELRFAAGSSNLGWSIEVKIYPSGT
jgi:hypothetical protein